MSKESRHAEVSQQTKHTPGCIEWNGFIDSGGYGRQSVNGKWCPAHRIAWEKVNGLIADNMQLDHLCRNRCCVNPDHLEVVTPKENILRGIGPTAINARKKKCIRGHNLIGENLRIRPNGRRECKECSRLRWRQYRLRAIKNGTFRLAISKATGGK